MRLHTEQGPSPGAPSPGFSVSSKPHEFQGSLSKSVEAVCFGHFFRSHCCVASSSTNYIIFSSL